MEIEKPTKLSPEEEEQKTLDKTIEEGMIYLKGLLTYENPNRKEYNILIKEVEEKEGERKAFREGGYYAEHVGLPPNNQIEYFSEKLKGEPLVDLGSGGFGTMKQYFFQFIRKVEPETYILVDRYSTLYGDKSDDPYQPVNLIPNDKKLKDYMVKADMLNFISRLPNNSVNYTINGIDSDIINNQEYHQALAREIVRTMKKGGIVFGNNSDCLRYIRDQYEDQIKEIKSHTSLGIFEKK